MFCCFDGTRLSPRGPQGGLSGAPALLVSEGRGPLLAGSRTASWRLCMQATQGSALPGTSLTAASLHPGCCLALFKSEGRRWEHFR